MKIKRITNPKEFFERLQECAGQIVLETNDGDRLNLKSKLCQYILLSDMFNNAKIEDFELYFSNPEDVIKIFDYLVRG